MLLAHGAHHCSTKKDPPKASDPIHNLDSDPWPNSSWALMHRRPKYKPEWVHMENMSWHPRGPYCRIVLLVSRFVRLGSLLSSIKASFKFKNVFKKGYLGKYLQEAWPCNRGLKRTLILIERLARTSILLH